MRLFIALPIPESAKTAIGKSIEEVKEKCTGVRWVQPGAMHITLFFLGELNPEDAEKIKERMISGKVNIKSFTAAFQGVTSFPLRGGKPRVLITPIVRGRQECVEIQKRSVSFAAGIVEPDKRQFIPHITLGRVKEPSTIGHDVFTLQCYGEFPVSRLVLYESILKPRGAEYRELLDVRLIGDR